MLRLNETRKYPGATYYGAGVIEAAECCGLYDVSDLAAMCGAAGYPYSIVNGQIFMEITGGQLTTACTVAAPAVDAVDNPALVDAEGRQVTGDRFGERTGEVWIADAATWGGSSEFAEQTVTAWGDGSINFTCVEGTFGDGPYTAYLYVETACGQRNAAGEEVSWPAP